jgi:hypothetical protein
MLHALVAAHSKATRQRSQLIEPRRPVIERWAQFLSGQEQSAEIIPLAHRRA